MSRRVCLWSYRPVDITCFPIYAENETQRMWFRCNVESESLRLRFSNEYNYFRLSLSEVTVAVCDENGVIQGPFHEVLFNGQKSVAILPDSNICSDFVDIHVKSGCYLAVSVYFKDRVKMTSACINRAFRTEHMAAGAGNLCHSTDVPSCRWLSGASEFSTANGSSYNLICGALWAVDGVCADEVHEIYAFGDSITNHGYWSEALASRFYGSFGGKVSFCNLGISGNKILNETTSMKKLANFFGERALSRFEKDVYGWGCKPDTLIMQIGINDIIHNVHGVSGPDVSAEEIFKGLCRLAEMAHEHGSAVACCTLTPFGEYFKDKTSQELKRHEDKRLAVNRMIKESGVFDCVVDYASLMEDPKFTSICRAGYTEDGLHPTCESGARLAELFDLDWFVR